jgi:hypothetical protein
MEILLLVLATLGILSQFLIDYFVNKNRKTFKLILGIVILTFACFGIWGSYSIQIRNSLNEIALNDSLKLKLQVANNKIVEMNKILLEVQDQNDTLIASLINLKYEVINSRIDANKLNYKTLNAIIQNQEKIESIKTINTVGRKRILTSGIKKKIIDELFKYPKQEIKIQYSVSDVENAQYAKQFVDVFSKSGWIVKEKGIIGEYDYQMREVNLIVYGAYHAQNQNNMIQSIIGIWLALQNAGIKCSIRTWEHAKPEEIILFISKGI